MRNDQQPSPSLRSPRELLVAQIDKGAVLLLLAGLAALALVFVLLFRPASRRDSAQSTYPASTLLASVPEASPQNRLVAQEPGSTNTPPPAPASAPSDDSRISRQNLAGYSPSEPPQSAVPQNIVAYDRVYTPAPTSANPAPPDAAPAANVPSSDSASDSSLQPSPNPPPDSPSSPADLIAPAIVNGAGTTTAYPLLSEWFNEFHKLAPASEFNYQAIGNGAGIKRLLENNVDFAAADVPMTDQQLAAAQTPILHIPSVLTGVVPIYNVAGAVQLRFSPAILVGIYSGKIAYWNDPLIAVSNPRANLPNEPITAIHRSDLCAATFVFTDYLSKISADWQQTVGKGTSVNWPVGLGAKGNEGVAGLVKQAPGTVGFVDYQYAMQNQIPFGSVQNSSGKFIKADLASLTAAAALPNLPTDFRVSITNAPGSDSYPIASFIWFLAPLRAHRPSEASDLVAFFRWMLGSSPQTYAGNLGYAPLPAALAARVQLQISKIH